MGTIVMRAGRAGIHDAAVVPEIARDFGDGGDGVVSQNHTDNHGIREGIEYSLHYITFRGTKL